MTKPVRQKSEELNNMLIKGHQMLTALGIPVAPLEKIEIFSKGGLKVLGYCYQNGNIFSYEKQTFSIEIAQKCLKEKTEGKPETFSVVLHELLHTCPDGMEGAKGHSREFIDRAVLVKKTYGYNLLAGCDDFSKVHTAPLYILECPECGSMMRYYKVNENREKRWKEIVEAGNNIHCGYCGSNAHITIKGVKIK